MASQIRRRSPLILGFSFVLRHIRRWINVFATLALIWIAYFTYNLEHSVSKQQEAHNQRQQESSRVSRSISLYQEIISSGTWEKLQDRTFKIDLEYKPGQSSFGELVASHVNRDGFQLRSLLSTFLMDLRVIYTCKYGGFCDQESIDFFAGPPALEVFYWLRPLIYCDTYMWVRFGNKPEGTDKSYLDLIKPLIADFQKHERETFGYETVYPIEMDREGETCTAFNSSLQQGQP